MKSRLSWLVLLLSILVIHAASAAQITVTPVCLPPEGWMAGGWGSYEFRLKNETDSPAKVVKFTACWEVAGEAFGDPWGEDRDVEVPSTGKATSRQVGYLPPEVVEKSKPGNAQMVGTVTVRLGDEDIELPFRLEIPAATLPEKLKLVKGKHVGLELMESRFKEFPAHERLLRWLDQSYLAMHELTGCTPYDGELVVIKEAPKHPWYAYAGNPVILNTAYVKSALKEASEGFILFGWVHEIGHDFDVFGKWYIWNGASSEWQANFKLGYAFEMIPDRSFKVQWGSFAGGAYKPPSRNTPVDGRQFVDSFFTFFGDSYLADPERKWDSMSSDELHSFFQRIVREYGWEPFKKWYRTYAWFEELGLDRPETPEEKINLIAAILSHHVGVDLVPVFQRWRMPVTAEQVETLHKRYPIAAVGEIEKPESAEAAAKLITMKMELVAEGGWMKGGYGFVRHTFKNEGQLPSKITAWNATWEVNGEPYVPEDDQEMPHDEDVFYLPAGEETVVIKYGWLDPKMLDIVKEGNPVWTGTFKLKTADLEFEVPWRIEVPEAVLKEKLVRVEGKHMAYEITETHYNEIGDGNERLIRWLDQAYEAMQDLTGYTPYGGKMITIKESPEHPHWAYAGNPIIMSTKWMHHVVKDVKKKQMPFGWIHELGHDFDIAEDVYGYDWYIWSGGACEAQANIKLVYVHEAIPDQDWKVPWSEDKHAAYHAPIKDMLLDGKECMDARFLFEADKYLADPTIPWDFGFCQHVFLQRIARVYGWDPVKKWYRTYKILEEKGCPKPETPEEKAQLMAAILSETVGVDMVPVFQRWRAPVTKEDVEALKKKYPIEETVKSIVLPGSEKGKTE